MGQIGSENKDDHAMIRLQAPLFAASCMLLVGATPVAAEYPARPITLIVPFAAGGSTDTIARMVTEHMAKTLGKPIIIENIAGAGGTTATMRAAQAPADGYTIIVGHMGTHGAAPAQYPNLKYDPVKDFTPIGLMAGLPIVIVTRKSFPADNLREFIDYTQKNQGKLNEAHAGVGSQLHTTCTPLSGRVETARKFRIKTLP